MLGAMRWVRTAGIGLLTITVPLLVAPPASATITIVGVDRGSGEVGAVGSSCAPVDLAATAVLVPGVGAATVLGPREERAAARLLRSLDEGSAADVLRRVERRDADAVHRYAVAVLPPTTAVGGAGVAPPIAGARTGATAAVQGEWLRDPDQVARALTAFEGSRGPLAERLLDALDAGNRGGGDRRCGSQRASTAFLIVAGPLGSIVIPARGLDDVRHEQQQVLNSLGGQIAADEVADRLLEVAALPRPVGPGAPPVYLSLLQSRHGFDAVTLIRQAYEESQASASPTASASPSATFAPTSSAPPATRERTNGGPDAFTALLVIGVTALIALMWSRRSRRDDGAGEDP